MIKVAVLDWNGTLLADTQAAVLGFNKGLEVLGGSAITIQEYRAHYDMPFVKLYKKLGFTYEEVEAKLPEISKAFHDTYEPRVAKVRSRAGTKSLLEWLARHKIDRIILSNHTMEGVYLQLERLNIGHYFNGVLANEVRGGAHFKSKQDRLADYLRVNSVDPSEVVIIGDTIEEVRIGKSLGLTTIAITGGFNSVSRLRQAQPDYLVHNLSDIKKVLK